MTTVPCDPAEPRDPGALGAPVPSAAGDQLPTATLAEAAESGVENRLPRVRDGLSVQAISAVEYVVRLRDSREYFSVGPQEAFLLEQLLQRRSRSEICAAWQSRFQSEFRSGDLDEFIQAIRPLGWLRSSSAARSRSSALTGDTAEATSTAPAAVPSGSAGLAASWQSRLRRRLGMHGQSWLFFRIPLYDPQHLFSRLAGLLSFLWTRTFLVLAVCGMLAAVCVLISAGDTLLSSFSADSGWRYFAKFILVALLCTALHEMAHGLTCCRFGGAVHETGFLFMFFTPCLYCNVSDAWLIPEKWKRLAITAAGSFCDLCLWAAAVFVWRLTVPGTGINELAFMVLTVCGGRSLLNLNPLLRLDGYYLLSDWLSIPNLRTRALDYWMGHLRCLLWGAARPAATDHAGILLVYGALCWCFAIAFLDLIFLQFMEYMGGQFGVTGLALVLLLLLFGIRRVFRGLFASELGVMLKQRTGRTALWAVGLTAATALLFLVPVKSTSSGEFEVRPGSVVQQHVPVTGIVERVAVEDGQAVMQGDLLAELRSPALAADILKTEDLLREVEANLKRLTAGTRPEELAAHRQRVRRLTEWHRLGLEELAQARVAHEQELLIQEHRIRETAAQLANARQDLAHSEELYEQGALAGAQLRSERLQLLQLESRLAQTEAALSAARATGIRAKEAEIARRAQELEDARDQLALLEAGSRPEEIAAEQARRERILHELAFLQSQKEKLQIRAAASGVFSAVRLRERVGQVALQDSLFCTIENPQNAHVEISVTEDDAAHMRPGLPVALKARAIPFETFEAVVKGISPTATKASAGGRNVVIVHCQIQNPDGRLKSGMTGFGRVYRGWNTMGLIMLSKGLKYLRTEFWW